MNGRRIILTVAAALALVAGGTAAGAAIASGPVDSSGVVHGCYATNAIKGSHVFELQDAGTSCPRGTTAIMWNQQGPRGPQGPPGLQGVAGPQGLPGATYQPQFYEAISPTDTYSAASFSSTTNSYGQYVGEANITNAVYCAPGDTMLSAQVVINNFFQADMTTGLIQRSTAVANGFTGEAVILNPTQDPIPGGTTYGVFTIGLCMTSGTPPVSSVGQYRDPRDS
jgi:hypothetical protein